MKKSAIALAVASALAASAAVQAETTFYGRAALALTYTEKDRILDPDDINQPDDIIDLFDDGVWDIANSGSRWGVRGSQDIGNGLSAIYHFETEITADDYNGRRDGQRGRLAWVGLQGGFGAIKLGSQWSPYYNALGATDIFNEAGWFSYYKGPFRQANSILYETPGSISAVKGEVLLVIDGDANVSEEDGVDEYHIGVSGSFGPAFVGAAYLNDEGVDADQWGISGSVDFAGASIAALYENWDLGGDVDGDTYYLTAQYRLGNNILKAGWGRQDFDDGDEFDEWAVGVQHNLNNRTRVWIEYADDDVDDEAFMSIGLRHDF